MKYVCPVCGYVHEGANPPAECPVCHVPGEKFTVQAEEAVWASEHVVGVGKQFGPDVPEEVQEEIIAGLKANFEGECTEVGMYLAMARVAYREGYPEIGMYWEKAGLEEAEHAAKFAELLGEVVTASTKKNLEMRVDAENGATAGKTELANLAKKYNLDAIHDTVHEMAKDEARHGKAFEGLLKRYFAKEIAREKAAAAATKAAGVASATADKVTETVAAAAGAIGEAVSSAAEKLSDILKK